MKKIAVLLMIACLIFSLSHAQQSIRDVRKKSWQTLVYTIHADSAEYYYNRTLKDPDRFLKEQPFAVLPADSADPYDLPVGNYVLLEVRDNELVAEVFCRSDIRVMPINNQRRLQFEVKNSNGQLIQNARLWVNKREIKFDPANNSFTIPGRKHDGDMLKIAMPGDTLFMDIWLSDEMYNNYKGAWSQWWRNFSNTRTGWIISTPVRKIKKMITTPAYDWFRHRRYKKKWSNNGYLVFNKPKYLPGDTVRFKAFVLNKKKKQVRGALGVYLQYYQYNKSHHDKLSSLKPYRPSAFMYDFVLDDSLDIDKDYTISLENKKGHSLLQGRFRLEDYLLDEVASYSFRTSKENYYRGDSVVIYADAKDANGLAVMDGRVRFIILAQKVDKVYPGYEFVPDTLWQEEKRLLTAGETRFSVSTDSFPQADMNMRILVQFLNSNNELQEREQDLRFYANNDRIDVKQEGAFLVARHMVKGVSVSSAGWMEEGDENIRPVQFPYSQKINPYAEDYYFYIRNDSGRTLQTASFEPESRYTISFRRVQQNDTSGFVLYNPYQVPVHYTVGYGSSVIAEGSDTATSISWKDILHKRKNYTVQWNYIWAGEEMKMSDNIAVLDKLLETTITGSAVIYPGQTDTLTVQVKNYKGSAAAGVDLTALSYNNEFGNDIRVPEPPYLERFHFRRRIYMNDYELEDAGYTRKFLLGEYPRWRKNFGLDTMLYYQFLFPSDSIVRKSEYTGDFLSQVAIHVVKKGVPQEVYMLFLNREFAYYNGVKDKSNYAFAVYPGYMQVGIRLKDQYIGIDSIYVQPFYKHDIVFDLDRLPTKATVEERPLYYTPYEINSIESHIWQLHDDYKTNNGYIWQGTRLFYLNAAGNHLAGPFTPWDSLQYFKPGSFDIKFPFESNYQYRLTPKMARLEHRNIFNPGIKNYLPPVQKTAWRLGDTLLPPPEIRYDSRMVLPFILEQTDNGAYTPKGESYGSLHIETPTDSTFLYAVLYDMNKPGDPLVKTYRLNDFYALHPGTYKLILVTTHYGFFETNSLLIQGNGTNYLNMRGNDYKTENVYIINLAERQSRAANMLWPKTNADQKGIYLTDSLSYSGKEPVSTGQAGLKGSVKDKNGKEAIVGASVMIKGTTTGTQTDLAGNFILKNVKPGRYILVISGIGYESKEIEVFAGEGTGDGINVSLQVTSNSLDEVVVVGYGTLKRSSLTGSVSKISTDEISYALQGKVAGISINASPGSSASIRIRGASSINYDAKMLYVVNGVLMDKLPEGMDLEGAQMSLLKDASAMALYGSRAADGVMVITTKEFIPKALRENFKDYAFWKPNLLTDKQGEVKFTVTYPDNVTGWQTYVIGMDKKKRITKSAFFTKSYKPLLARLSTPQFLIEGDSAALIGKTINYTNDPVSIRSSFMEDEKGPVTKQLPVESNGSAIEELPVYVPPGMDTLSVQYTVTDAAGFSDGELRKIPVFRKGTEETKGIFSVLDRDTSFSFLPDSSAGGIVIHAQNNTLDVLLSEIGQLKRYPYYCMEQTASKLTGLLMEKKIMESLKKPFRDQKDINMLLTKLQKSQLYNGGWGWWQDGNVSLSITNYVVASLLPLRSDPVVESNVRNGILYLQNQLPVLKRDQLISVLYTLSEAANYMDYKIYLQKIPFDSISIHQQWQITRIKQQQGLDFAMELDFLLGKKQQTMTGGLYWGEDSYYWDSNRMSTTVIAYKVLERIPQYHSFLENIIQFFLERRAPGYWMNTVESARITEAILPEILKIQGDFTNPASVSVNGARSAVTKEFPFTLEIPNNGAPVSITKTGGGLVYFTAWQHLFNKTPRPVTDNFVISAVFERNNEKQIFLKGGEKVVMKVRIRALKDAEYVKIEIPIPAGCTYAEKKNEDWSIHKEYFKDRVVLFVEKMRTGDHDFEIELEPRYAGAYQLNPVKAELMYFPVIYGRNAMNEVRIINQ